MKKLLTLFIAAAVLALAGCGKTPAPQQQPAKEPQGTAVIGLASPITGKYFFTDAWGTTGTDSDISKLIFGGNTVTTDKKGELVYNDGVLKSVDICEEKNGDRTYTFTLNDGLKFSDGSSLTAKDYVFSVLLQSSYAFLHLENASNTRYSHLVGWEEFASGKSNQFEGVELISDNQFSLTIDGDKLPYYDEMSMVDICPLPRSVLAPELALTASGWEWNSVTTAQLRNTLLGSTGYRFFPTVTAGPYMLTDISGRGTDTVLTLEYNPYYAPAEKDAAPRIASLQISTANLSAPENYDLICGLSGKEIAAARDAVADCGMTDYLYQSNVLSAVLFGESVPLRVRHALAALLDPEDCTELLAARWGEPIIGLNLPSDELTKTYRLDLIHESARWNDPSLAETLLAGSEPAVTLTFDRDDPDAAAMAAHLADVAEDSDLLTIQMRPVDRSALTSILQSGEYELLFFHDELSGMPWEGPEKLTGKLAEAAEYLAETSGGLDYRYEEKWLAFQDLYQQELPALGICSYEHCDLTGKRLTGYGEPTAQTDWTKLILSAEISE
ncbi:MAG: hypothetical protein IJD13_10105 [Oscillospiraceae bacterium]|nr:hypothetical protein [Oscillospiraceae bacterium]